MNKYQQIKCPNCKGLWVFSKEVSSLAPAIEPMVGKELKVILRCGYCEEKEPSMVFYCDLEDEWEEC